MATLNVYNLRTIIALALKFYVYSYKYDGLMGGNNLEIKLTMEK